MANFSIGFSFAKISLEFEIKKMIYPFKNLLQSRFWALAVKEIRQLLRNKQLLFLLLFPPTIQICLYGFVMNPDVNHLKLGIVDHLKQNSSREFISALTENKVFIPAIFTESEASLSEYVRDGKIKAGIVIPPDFQRKLNRNISAEVQVFIDGADAYTGGVAAAYIAQIINAYNFPENNDAVKPEIIALYNPGLVNSWFFVLGVIGTILTMVSIMSSSIQAVQEKDTGTLEQLLMTPANSFEVLLAKILPLTFLLTLMLMVSLLFAYFIFSIPFKGSLLLLIMISSVYILIGVGIGLLLSAFSPNRQQVILTSVFVALPMFNLSGAISPLESMPEFFQYLTLLNPLRYYVQIIRGIILKGQGIDTLWGNVLILFVFAAVIITVSSIKYRSQLS